MLSTVEVGADEIACIAPAGAGLAPITDLRPRRAVSEENQHGMHYR